MWMTRHYIYTEQLALNGSWSITGAGSDQPADIYVTDTLLYILDNKD